MARTALATVEKIHRLRTGRRVEINDDARTIQLLQTEILRSGWYYDRIATEAGVALSTVGNIASGQTQHPRLQTIWKIFNALGWRVVAEER